MFFLEHIFFGAAGPAAFLTPDLFPFLLLIRPFPKNLRFDFIGQNATGEESISRLGSVLLALDPYACWPVDELNAGRRFIDVLAAGSA